MSLPLIFFFARFLLLTNHLYNIILSSSLSLYNFFTSSFLPPSLFHYVYFSFLLPLSYCHVILRLSTFPSFVFLPPSKVCLSLCISLSSFLSISFSSVVSLPPRPYCLSLPLPSASLPLNTPHPPALDTRFCTTASWRRRLSSCTTPSPRTPSCACSLPPKATPPSSSTTPTPSCCR